MENDTNGDTVNMDGHKDESVHLQLNGNFFDDLVTNPQDDNCNKIFNRYKLQDLNYLDFDSFVNLSKELYYDHRSCEPFHVPFQWLTDIFKKFDINNDDKIDQSEFNNLYNLWIHNQLYPRTALIIVDVQNDFITGSLAIYRCPAGQRGEEVIPIINEMIKTITFNLIVYSYDWHPNDHISFYENYHKRKIIERNGAVIEDDSSLDDVQLLETVTFEGPPMTVQKLWPRHCVQNTWGSQLYPDLVVHESNSINIYKGTNPNIDSYSAFWDNGKLSETGLASELMKRNITDVYVCGIAYDVCVAATTDHANEYGFKTTLINDASRGVDSHCIAEKKNYLINKSVVIVDSDQVALMARGLLRRPEHGYHWAMHH